MGTKFTPTQDSFSSANLSKWIELIQAVADGKTIQYYNGLHVNGDQIWIDLVQTSFLGRLANYRIKTIPEVIEIRKNNIWARKSPDSLLGLQFFKFGDDVTAPHCKRYNVEIKLTEVLDNHD